MCVCVSAWHKVKFFKRSAVAVGLNSVFCFSEISFFTNAKKQRLPYYLPIAGENRWIHAFDKGISMK